MSAPTETDLKDRGFKIVALHAYGWKSGSRPDYKVVPVGYVVWNDERRNRLSAGGPTS